MHLPSLANIRLTCRWHSFIPMCHCPCRENCKLDACQGMLFHGCQGTIHELTHKHMICSWARGLQTVICSQVDQQGSQGLHMVASTWLAKNPFYLKEWATSIMYNSVSIWFDLDYFGGFLLNQQQHLCWKISITLHRHSYFHLLVMIPSLQ